MNYEQNPYGPQQPQYGPQQPQSGPQQPQYGGPQNGAPAKPDNYLVWAILVTICCCLPLGIVAIVYSCQVNNAYSLGNYDLALKKSQDTKKWCMIAAIVGIVYWIVMLILQLVAGLSSLL